MDSIRNIYKNDIDFAVLALHDRDFAKHMKSNGQLDFSNPEAVQQLTKSLLKRDFKIIIKLPPDRLCPPVPNRLNYILWLQDLLDTTNNGSSDQYDPKRDVTGLDIGTGASCIYPLLGCSLRSKWRFVATELDEKSLECASSNIRQNNLKSRIRPMKNEADGPLIPLDVLGFEKIDFTMCNPPFYTSQDEMLSSAKEKSRPPFSACTGSPIEMIYPGGEIAFVSRMIDESVILRGRVQWYTSMLGKLSSVSAIIEKLKSVGIANWAATEFIQGNKTRRWAIAWSWDDWRPPTTVSRNITGLQKHHLPFPPSYSFTLFSISLSKTFANLRVLMDFKSPLFHAEWVPASLILLAFFEKNLWSRGARRRIRDPQSGHSDNWNNEDAALGVKIQLSSTKERPEDSEIYVRWLKGNDSVIFESFCGMLKREIGTASI
ncbi:MAG: hypothetical protein M1834_007364 [Cirrosporium novae-zelandiae]|nr:MAG: hypothetical protein M1834_007364 [Cirrosporium novae-zelandiae]